MTLSVIIVHYNVPHFLEQCLHALQRAEVATGKLEVVVVDNHSTDGNVTWIREHFPWVRLVENNENVGFSKANNQGWQMATGEIILFLNPDTIVGEHSLTRALKLFDDPKVGAVGLHMVDGNGRFLPESKRGKPTATASFHKLFGLSKIFPGGRFGGYYRTDIKEAETRQVDVLSGAAMLVRRSVLQQTGGFDERFFMYAEDIDLSYSIRQAGFQILYAGNAVIIHFKGESTLRDGRYVKEFYKSMLQFVSKHYRGSSGVFYRLLLKSGVLLRGVVAWPLTIIVNNTAPAEPATAKRLVVAASQEVGSVQAILNAKGLQFKLMELPDNVDILQKKVADNGYAEIIFVAGRLTYDEIISFYQALSGKLMLSIHANNSTSIVSSSSKNSNGTVRTIVSSGKIQQQ